ncbi:MAG TPA: chemotaxis protein CheD [Spirochaetota bacterium]|nr:chemotaxis protein CheD [Spirochaetota bacterium]
MKKNVEEIYLYPGDFYITDQQRKVVTILGSCVAVVMSVNKFHMGGIIHGIFPNSKDNPNLNDTRYTNLAIYKLLNTFLNMGIKKHDIDVKVFGGANINLGISNIIESVGNKNIQIAFDILKKEQLEIKTQDVGGNRGRKLLFYPYTGEVYMKYLEKFDNNLLDLEKKEIVKEINIYEKNQSINS